jgi:hypothetical protein
MNPADKCCSSADCKNLGGCWSTQTLPGCGNDGADDWNECMGDACNSDASCNYLNDLTYPKFCAPAGAFGVPVRLCYTAACHTRADCTAHPGGVCAPLANGPDCSTPVTLTCVYPGGCVTNADCGHGKRCVLDATTGTTSCVSAP